MREKRTQSGFTSVRTARAGGYERVRTRERVRALPRTHTRRTAPGAPRGTPSHAGFIRHRDKSLDCKISDCFGNSSRSAPRHSPYGGMQMNGVAL
jgi:hypothetical protein